MRFICRNAECEKFNVEEIEPQVVIGLKDGNIFFDKTPCPVCKEDREYLKPYIESYKDHGVMIVEQFGSVNKNWSKPVKNPIY